MSNYSADSPGYFTMRFLIAAAFILFSFWLSAKAQIIINEVMPVPLTGEPEWVELFNRGTKSAVMDSCWVHDTRTAIRLPKFSVPAEGYAILTRDTFALREIRQVPPKAILVECKLPSLNNTSDIVAVRTRDSLLTDSVYYNMKWGRRGMSLERKRADTSAVSQYNWFVSESPDSATAGEVNSVSPLRYDARITAVFVPKQEQNVSVIVENNGLWKLDSIKVGLFADIDKNGIPIAEELIAEAFSTTLQPTEKYALNVPFASVSAVFGNEGITPLIAICRAASDTRRRNDTLRRAAYIPYSESRIRINEIMFEPPPNCSDYVELFNASESETDLGGWVLHDRPLATGADTLRFPVPFVIAPHGYAVIAADSGILTQFPDLRGDARLFIANSRYFNLNSDRDITVLLDPNGNMADSLEYGDTWHTSVIPTAKGISLEKIAPELPAAVQSSWSSCGAPAGGTPLTANSIAVEPSNSGHFEASPQPFIVSGSATGAVCLLSYALPFRQVLLTVTVYTRSGVPVKTIANGIYSTGEGNVVWDGRDESQTPVQTGMYAVILEAIDATTGEVRREKIAIAVGN
ncbi:hypothetical protein MASR2M18_15690 [Ignavibacteria bacterium]|nr:lamin tail domain-containing protein [Bacteroidota bacterium]MCZ2133195.1 lamin tail domain-containing protein [Bacteroidota bacterium]